MTAVAHSLSPAESAALTRRVTLMSVGTALILVLMKAAAWVASGSVALLASMADSGLDLIASLVTFFAVRYAAAPPFSANAPSGTWTPARVRRRS